MRAAALPSGSSHRGSHLQLARPASWDLARMPVAVAVRRGSLAWYRRPFRASPGENGLRLVAAVATRPMPARFRTRRDRRLVLLAELGNDITTFDNASARRSDRDRCNAIGRRAGSGVLTDLVRSARVVASR